MSMRKDQILNKRERGGGKHDRKVFLCLLRVSSWVESSGFDTVDLCVWRGQSQTNWWCQDVMFCCRTALFWTRRMPGCMWLREMQNKPTGGWRCFFILRETSLPPTHTHTYLKYICIYICSFLVSGPHNTCSCFIRQNLMIAFLLSLK